MILRIARVNEAAITPGLAVLPAKLNSPEARVLMLAIGLQESNLTARYQILPGGKKGPARGWSQFELGARGTGAGVWGVFEHRASAEPLRLACRALDVQLDPRVIWGELEHNDTLAAVLTRLLLLTDPHPLPALGDVAGGWAYYQRNWRPGKPHPEVWPEKYALALREVQGV